VGMLSAGYCNKIALLSFVIHNYIKVIGYCYYLVNLIRYGLAQGDHIKWCLPSAI
jgi:hypothetical protein